jgi:hypothetical protein
MPRENILTVLGGSEIGSQHDRPAQNTCIINGQPHRIESFRCRLRQICIAWSALKDRDPEIAFLNNEELADECRRMFGIRDSLFAPKVSNVGIATPVQDTETATYRLLMMMIRPKENILSWIRTVSRGFVWEDIIKMQMPFYFAVLELWDAIFTKMIVVRNEYITTHQRHDQELTDIVALKRANSLTSQATGKPGLSFNIMCAQMAQRLVTADRDDPLNGSANAPYGLITPIWLGTGTQKIDQKCVALIKQFKAEHLTLETVHNPQTSWEVRYDLRYFVVCNLKTIGLAADYIRSMDASMPKKIPVAKIATLLKKFNKLTLPPFPTSAKAAPFPDPATDLPKQHKTQRENIMQMMDAITQTLVKCPGEAIDVVETYLLNYIKETAPLYEDMRGALETLRLSFL